MKRAASFAICLLSDRLVRLRRRARCPGPLRLDYRRRPRSERRRGAWCRSHDHAIPTRAGPEAPRRTTSARPRFTTLCLRALTRCASTFPGFKEFRTTGVRVSEDNVLRVNSLLEVGQVTDTVTVSAGVAVLQTDRADVRTEIPDDAAREPAGAGRAQLSESVRHRSRHLAAREHAFGRGEPGARAGLQLERHDAQRQRDPHRRRHLEQPLAAARRRLRARARSDRIGGRDDEHLRRRSGTVGRHVGERADQERHEPAARLGCSSTSTTSR